LGASAPKVRERAPGPRNAGIERQVPTDAARMAFEAKAAREDESERTQGA
jgi:hypothetical protein